MISTNEAHRTALSVSLIQERRHCCDTPLWLLPAGKLNVARNLPVADPGLGLEGQGPPPSPVISFTKGETVLTSRQVELTHRSFLPHNFVPF